MTRVVVRSDVNLRQAAEAGRHTILVDEPAELGGDDLGPGPYDLLLAALGACTSMTILMYARRKGWAVENIEVQLTHSRIHARDCADCEQQEGYLDAVDKQITLFGTLDEEQVRRLGEIAEKCPVNRTLHASVHTRQEIRLASG